MSRPSSAYTNSDEVDRRLVDLLMLDGRMTNRALAEEVGLTDATVAVRVRRLIENRQMDVGPLFDWAVAGFRSQAMAYLSVRGTSPQQLGIKLLALPGVHTVDLTYGDADIVALLLARDARAMHMLATDIGALEGVVSLRVDEMVEVFAYSRPFATLLLEPFPLEDFPEPPFDFDDLDRVIIDCLRADGRQSNREIARKAEVSDATIRSRRQRMENLGLLRVGAIVDSFATGRVAALAHVGLEITADPGVVAKEFLKFPGTAFCASTTGTHGLVGTVALSPGKEQLHMVTELLWEWAEVRTVRTWPVVRILGERSDLIRLV